MSFFESAIIKEKLVDTKRSLGMRNERLVGLFILGMVFLNYPILSLFAYNGSVMGIPILYWSIFVIWLSLVILYAIATHTDESEEP
jgi:hypothetical protein